MKSVFINWVLYYLCLCLSKSLFDDLKHVSMTNMQKLIRNQEEGFLHFRFNVSNVYNNIMHIIIKKDTPERSQHLSQVFLNIKVVWYIRGNSPVTSNTQKKSLCEVLLWACMMYAVSVLLICSLCTLKIVQTNAGASKCSGNNSLLPIKTLQWLSSEFQVDVSLFYLILLQARA